MAKFTFHTIETASDEATPILNQIQKSYGFIPNLFAYMAEAPTTLEAYLTLNKLVEKTSLTGSQQQVALLSASIQNNCSFCIVAHRAMGKKSGANQQTLGALDAGEKIENAEDAVLSAFTRTVVENRGQPSDEAIEKFLDAGFTKQQIFEVILIVTIKTLSNYSNHLTHPEPNPELLTMANS